MATEIESLGSRLKKAREHAGLSLAEVGALVGCGHQRIWNYESRGDDIGAEMLFKIADALQVDPRWLATGQEGAPQGSAIDEKTFAVARAIALMPQERRDALATLLGVKLGEDVK